MQLVVVVPEIGKIVYTRDDTDYLTVWHIRVSNDLYNTDRALHDI